MKLSVCLAVFNEEKFIRFPLDSIIDFADEIIVVDGGSEDKTIDILKSYGEKVKIFHEKNPKMFHINKQKAIEKAQGEWILQLDADEVVSDDLKNEIKKIVLGGERGRVPDSAQIMASMSSTGGKETLDRTQNYVAYWLPRKNFFLNRFLTKGGAYPDYTIRLYKNGVARFPCKTVHENVTIDGEIGYLKKDLLHYADPDFTRYLNRWNRYTSLDAEILAKEKNKLSFFSYFFVKPHVWFFKSYFRHRGFMDGFPGFVFALFSSLRFCVIYIKFWNLKNKKEIKELF